MPDDSEMDLGVFPEGVDPPSLLASSAGAVALDTGVQLLSFPFCLRFAGRPWMTLQVAAPSPEDAARTMQQFVDQVLNPALVKMHYPPGVCTFSPGEC